MIGLLIVGLAVIVSSYQRKGDTGAEGRQAGESQGQGSLAARFGAEMTYDELLTAIDEGKIKRAAINQTTGETVLTFDDGSRAKVIAPIADEGLPKRLSKSGAEVSVTSRPYPGGSLFGALRNALLALLIIGVLVFAYIRFVQRRQQMSLGAGGGLGELRGSAKVSDEERPRVTFKDLAGCEEAVEETREFLDFLLNPQKFLRVGARMPSGLILHGPPGTGKTTLAKALAGEAQVPFFAVSGSDFVEKYVGVGAARVRELFARARREETGAVIFIDEIDAIGRRRGSTDSTNDERESTLNELLTQLDGFNDRDRIVVVAATNRLDILDPALLRPGRFARQVRVDLPDREGRRRILMLHSRDKKLADDVDLDRLAEITAGSSGADLAEMLNEAAIMAARAGRLSITQKDLNEGHLRVLAGPEKRSNFASEEELEIIAYHEAGHVLCAELSPTHEKAQRATINPRGQAAGLAVYGQVDRALHSLQHLHEQLVCVLGGRAAEQVMVGSISSGAANDLQKANTIARQAIEELGFSGRVGQMTVSGAQGRHSERSRRLLDSEVKRMIDEAYADAVRLLTENRSRLEALARLLLERRDVDRDEIIAAIGSLPQQSRPTTVALGPRSQSDPDLSPEPGERRRGRRIGRGRPRLALRGHPIAAAARGAMREFRRARRRRARADERRPSVS